MHHRVGQTIKTIDHGQVVGYAGDKPIETAINGSHRIGTHSKFGFGEIRVIPVKNINGENLRDVYIVEQEKPIT